MFAYVPVIFSFFLGMGVFGLMRWYDKDPILSGATATIFAMGTAVALFFLVLKTGNL